MATLSWNPATTKTQPDQWATGMEQAAMPPVPDTITAPKQVGGRIRQQDVADITAQLAIMTRSGVDIASALGSLSRQCRNASLAEVLKQTHEDITSGVPFSEALSRHPAVFDDAYVATVSAGEATGNMPDVFAQLAELKRSELKLRRTIRALMTYPVLLASVSLVVMAALILFVLPQFAGVFEQFDTPLPVITQLLIGLADELRGRWWLWLPVAGCGLVGIASLRFTAAGKRWLDRFLLTGYGIGAVTQKILVGRICRLVGLMIDSGVPLLEALALAKKSTKNVIYQDLMAQMDEAVTNGRSMTSVLEQSEVFPPSATEMIGTAEQTGKLGEVLHMVGIYFEEEGEAAARQTVGLLEPLITVVMGAIVAVIVLAVMLPVFDLSSFAGKH